MQHELRTNWPQTEAGASCSIVWMLQSGWAVRWQNETSGLSSVISPWLSLFAFHQFHCIENALFILPRTRVSEETMLRQPDTSKIPSSLMN